MAPDRPSNLAPEIIARDVLEGLLEGCQVIGFDGTYLYLNDAAARQGQSPKSELLGRTIQECYPGVEATPMFATLTRCMAQRVHARMENEFTFPDGTTGSFELRFIPVPEGVCILSLDVTESKRTAAALQRSEAQLRQAQKLEAIGRLAGGVAHDFNNLLTAILGYGHLLGMRLPAGDPSRPDVDEILLAGERAAQLTRQLLAFSSQQVLEPKVLDLNAVVTGLEPMLRRLIGEDIDLATHVTVDLGRVMADPGQIEQVLMNLVVNARDAMPSGGTLTIETANVDLDDGHARIRPDLKPGRYVLLAVSDSGMGMTAEVRSRIFEPFFTTKERGHGTGLGLATVHGIVKQSDGNIEVYSEPGQGATFKVYLPRVEGELERPAAPAPAVSFAASGETILVVDDDEVIRHVVRESLELAGFTVLEAGDGSQAIATGDRAEQAIDLLVTDVVLPLMSGVELSQRMQSRRPDLRVLFMSGYTDRALVHQGLRRAGTAFLQKPFTPNALVRKVGEVLSQSHDPAV